MTKAKFIGKLANMSAIKEKREALLCLEDGLDSLVVNRALFSKNKRKLDIGGYDTPNKERENGHGTGSASLNGKKVSNSEKF